MPYQDYERGAATSEPLELYEFIGTYNTYLFTSNAEVVRSNGQDYTPMAISRNKLKVGTQEDTDNALEITLPYDQDLVREYAYENSPPRLEMKLKRAHRGDPNDTVTLWAGKVTAFSVAGRVAKMKVPSLFSWILQGNAPVPRYQAPCNFVLYDERCGVPLGPNSHTTVVVSVNGNRINIENSPFGDGECIAGEIINLGGEGRMIIRNVGTDITTSYAFAGLKAGDTVTIRKGCDHSIETCRQKFNNQARFGGFPLVPDRNPFTSSLT